MTNDLLRFKEVASGINFKELDFCNMKEKKDKTILRRELDFLLQKQGFTYTSKDIIDVFTIYKLNQMISNNIDLIDMDRWNAVESILKKEITFDDAMHIVNVLWEEDIEVLELL